MAVLLISSYAIHPNIPTLNTHTPIIITILIVLSQYPKVNK